MRWGLRRGGNRVACRGCRRWEIEVCGDWAGPLYTPTFSLTPATLLGCIFAPAAVVDPCFNSRNARGRQIKHRAKKLGAVARIFFFWPLFLPFVLFQPRGTTPALCARFFRFDDQTTSERYSSLNEFVFICCRWWWSSTRIFQSNKRERGGELVTVSRSC